MSRPLSTTAIQRTPTPRASSSVLPGGDSPASRKPADASPSSPEQSPTTEASPVSAAPRNETPRSEGYPSWLPRRPRPPPPQSTVHSQQLEAFADHPEHHIGERRPTPRSVRIVSVTPSQTSHESRNHSQPLPTEGGLAPPPRSPARAYSRHTSAALVSHLNPTPLPAMGPPPPRFATRGLNLQLLRDPSLLSRIRFYTLPLFVFAHIPLQAFFDLNVVYILLQ